MALPHNDIDSKSSKSDWHSRVWRPSYDDGLWGHLADTQAADITSANPDVCSLSNLLIWYKRSNDNSNTINSININGKHVYNNSNGKRVTRFVRIDIGICIGIITLYIQWKDMHCIGRLDRYPSTLVGIF